MHPQKQMLITLLKTKLALGNAPADIELSQLDDDKLADACFFRSIGSSGGFRLTDSGVELFCRFFEHWNIPLSDVNVNPWAISAGILKGKPNNGNTLQVVQLDRYFSSPWFLATGFYYKADPHIVVFEPTAAMRLKLCQGDLSVFLKKYR